MLRHLFAWVFVLILSLAISPGLLGYERYESTIVSEMEDAAGWYGGAEVERLRDGAQSMYLVMVHDSGLARLISGNLPTSSPTRSEADAMWSRQAGDAAVFMANYWRSFLLGLYAFCLRLYHAWIWLLYLAPFLFAVVFDGIMVRKAKLQSFRYTSPTVYNASWHAIIGLLAGTLVYFAWSFGLSLFLYPVAITAIGFLVRTLIANVQPSV